MFELRDSNCFGYGGGVFRGEWYGSRSTLGTGDCSAVGSLGGTMNGGFHDDL